MRLHPVLNDKCNILPVDPTAQTAIGVTHESQSRGVSKLLLQTAPLLFTQTSHESGSEPGYDDDEHSNNVMWCTIDFFVLKIIIRYNVGWVYIQFIHKKEFIVYSILKLEHGRVNVTFYLLLAMLRIQ